MSPPPDPRVRRVRRATVADAETVGRLLHDFNSEYDNPTPGPGALAERLRQLIGAGEVSVLLTADGAHGLALLRLRPYLWGDGLDCYLEELYVVPDRRGQGLGRALMEAAIELARDAGAVRMDLGTGAEDVAARTLYESLGFSSTEGEPGAPANYFYEREL